MLQLAAMKDDLLDAEAGRVKGEDYGTMFCLEEGGARAEIQELKKM